MILNVLGVPFHDISSDELNWQICGDKFQNLVAEVGQI
jgi:hypothetical protein